MTSFYLKFLIWFLNHKINFASSTPKDIHVYKNPTNQDVFTKPISTKFNSIVNNVTYI